MLTDLDLETRDLDWFSTDTNGRVIHFTTGGRGFFPAALRPFGTDLANLRKFLRHDAPQTGAPIASAILPSEIDAQSFHGNGPRLDDWYLMASKGLFSFDYASIPKRPGYYFLVARPSKPISASDLPKEFQTVVAMARILCSVETGLRIFETDIESPRFVADFSRNRIDTQFHDGDLPA